MRAWSDSKSRSAASAASIVRRASASSSVSAGQFPASTVTRMSGPSPRLGERPCIRLSPPSRRVARAMLCQSACDKREGWQWPRMPPGWARRTRRSSCSSARPATFPSASSSPGLYHLCTAGFIPGCRIIGVSLDEIDADGFRTIARDGARPVLRTQGEGGRLARLRRDARLRAALRRRRAAEGGRRTRRAVARQREPPPPLSERPAECGALPAVQLACRGGPGRALPHHHGKALRHRPRERGLAERPAARGLLPRTRFSASITSSARRRRRTSSRSASPTACSSRSGTATSSTTCRSTCRRRWRSASAPPSTRRSAPFATWWSRTSSRSSPSWRWSRRPRSSRAPISEEKNKVFRSMLPLDPKDVVRGQYTGYRERARRRPGIRHRDLHRAEMLDRQLALGRRAVLPAHRQAHGGRPAHHLDRLPRAAEEHVSGRLGRRRAGAGSPDLRSRRRVEDVALLLRQAARPRHAARQAEPAVRHARHRAASARCWRPTSG